MYRKLPDDYGNTSVDTNVTSIDDISSSAEIKTRKKINKSPKQSKNDLTIDHSVIVNS